MTLCPVRAPLRGNNVHIFMIYARAPISRRAGAFYDRAMFDVVKRRGEKQ